MSRDANHEERCACGRPLHYASPVVQTYIRGRMAVEGSTVEVVTPQGTYLVPREYLVLHGIKVYEILQLADQFERTDGC